LSKLHGRFIFTVAVPIGMAKPVITIFDWCGINWHLELKIFHKLFYNQGLNHA
jgi:hypothetical protein